MRRKRHVLNILFSLALGLLVLSNIGIWYFVGLAADHALKIVFLNIGQGDSFLIISPDKYTLLVDGGREDDLALTRLQEVLPLWGNVDALMASHPDADHVGALADVIRHYQVKQILFNPFPHENKPYIDLEGELKSMPQKVLAATAGERFKLGCCVSIDILWPRPQDLASALDTNDISATFLLEYGQFRFFSGGDLPSPNEDKVSADWQLGHINLLKVSHHGSKNSSDQIFLGRIHPEVAVIQVGPNSYGHPTQEVLQNLAQIGCKIYRNDQQGNITYSTNGSTFNILTGGN